jgi:chromosome segregation ATPase
MSIRSSHQRWLAVLAAGGVATGGVVALTSAASATTPAATPSHRSTDGKTTSVAAPAGTAMSPLLAQTKQLSDEIAAARKRLAALGGSTAVTTYVTSSPALAAQAAQLAAERKALTAEAAALVKEERALQAEAKKLAAQAAALAAAGKKPPAQGGTGASGGSGGGVGGHGGNDG